MEIELERTFLLKKIPVDLKTMKSMEVCDNYIPRTVEHPILRIRRRGDKYEITKKHPIEGGDSSRQSEETIPLSKEEFSELSSAGGKKVRKVRYYYPFGANSAEIDIFEDELKGLALVDFEFKTIEEKNDFRMPDFCLVDVTQDKFTAGGVLAGKKYEDIEEKLKKYGYKKF